MSVPTTKPTFYLKMWEGVTRVVFCDLSLNQYFAMRDKTKDWRNFDFVGVSAVCRVITDNLSLTQQDALRIATSFMKGQYTEFKFDLDKCIVETLQGMPIIITPPY